MDCQYKFDGKVLDIKKLEFIGNGSQWDVYRLYLNKELVVNSIPYNRIIVKESRNENWNIHNTVEIYQKIVKKGIPTLSFYNIGLKNNNEVIFCEDINYTNILYVSPNSARKQNNDIQILLNNINDTHSLIDEIPITEKDLIENKLNDISNFDAFVLCFINDIEKIVDNNLAICADSFFFGVNKENEELVNYKIADFDNIDEVDSYNKDEKNGQYREALESLWEFTNFFVSKNDILNKKAEVLMNKYK